LLPGQFFDWYSSPELKRVLIGHFEQQIKEYRRWLDEGRQILLFDPAGDGRVVEVFGDLAGADHIGVVVPGMSNDVGNFSGEGGGFRENAARLHEESLDLGSQSVATVAWLGYDSPDGIGAATKDAAAGGAPALRRFVEGIDPGADRQVTVIAHSYGSVVAGLAASGGLAADDLVFVGSPGTTLDHADEAILRPEGRVWVALADDDPIGLGISPSELPPPWVPPPLLPVMFAIDLAIAGAEELWHGTNPASEEFGATRLATDGSSGHSAYFEAGSLHNLALIIQGLHDDLETVS
jgi:pimeloyl-ACP methyl ester carboxylesterase